MKKLGLLFIPIAALLCSCANYDREHTMVVSVPDQKMVLLKNNVPISTYPISTSKFGVGDRENSYKTPIGKLAVDEKIGGGAPPGTVFKNKRPTGEVVAVDAPGRDPIVTRILWLRGLDSGTRNAHGRCIYIHGTPEERDLGRPCSFGCIRMSSRDVIELFNTVGKGAQVIITERTLIALNLAPNPVATAATTPETASVVKVDATSVASKAGGSGAQ